MCGSNITKGTPLREHELYRGVYSISICAFDRQQAIEFFFEGFKDDIDINKVKITRVIGENLPNNEVQYTIFFRLQDQRTIEPNVNYRIVRESLGNPKCPKCSSISQKMGFIISQKGKRQRYRCLNCGKTFSEVL